MTFSMCGEGNISELLRLLKRLCGGREGLWERICRQLGGGKKVSVGREFKTERNHRWEKEKKKTITSAGRRKRSRKNPPE